MGARCVLHAGPLCRACIPPALPLLKLCAQAKAEAAKLQQNFNEARANLDAARKGRAEQRARAEALAEQLADAVHHPAPARNPTVDCLLDTIL